MVRIQIKKELVKSPLRDLLKIVKELKGMKTYPFNIGDPNKFDFDTPEFLKNELIKAVKERNGYYSEAEGDMELRKTIVERENKKNNASITEDDVIITQGISEGLSFIFSSLIDSEKDEFLLPGPAYPSYIQYIKFFGGKYATYKTDESDSWQPDIDDLRKKINENTKLISIINPNNPTGSVYESRIVKEIVNIAGEEEIPVLSDEIYDELIFDNTRYEGTSSIAKDIPVIGLNGFSKSYLVPGWRLGYMYFHDAQNQLSRLKELIKSLARNRLSACTPVMKAFVGIYSKPRDHIEIINKKLKDRAAFAHKKLNEIEGISAVKPQGSFYIFPKVELNGRWKNDEEFCIDLLKNTGIIFPYGSGFDPVYGKDHFRSVILPPVEMMEEAFGKLEDFMKNSK